MPPKIILDHNPRINAMLQKIGLMDIEGFEVYENVILAYDSDVDIRLREVVDRVTTYFRHNLILVHEQDGTLSMIWKNHIAEPFFVGQSIATTYPDGSLDHWHIGFSRLASDIEKDYKVNFWLDRFYLN